MSVKQQGRSPRECHPSCRERPMDDSRISKGGGDNDDTKSPFFVQPWQCKRLIVNLEPAFLTVNLRLEGLRLL